MIRVETSDSKKGRRRASAPHVVNRAKARHGAREFARSRRARRKFLPVALQKNVDSLTTHLYIASQRKEVTSAMAAKKAAKKSTKKTTKKTTKKK
jgi:hypothetical protein